MKPDAGFSLIEVLVAIMILGIAMVGLTVGLTTALSASKESEVQTAAALIAAGQIEWLRTEGYLTEGETEGEGVDGRSQYHWRQSIAGTSIDGLYEIRVVVWHTRTRQPLYELQTLLFDPPLSGAGNESFDRDRPRLNRRGGGGRSG